VQTITVDLASYQRETERGAAIERRNADLEALLRRIDAVITWETTPLGREFQDEIEAALTVERHPVSLPDR
jgi:hypothetical protein